MLETWQMVVVPFLALFCEYIDSTLGMGYGTTLTPILMLMGFAPLQIVPVVLMSELATGLLAAILHHREGNVDLKPKTADMFKITKLLKPLGYVDSFKRTVPLHLKIALLLSACSVVGTVAAVFVAVNIPKYWLKMYIGVLVLAMGIVMLICMRRQFKFSWKKVTGLGMLASFNKGISGGGYGPIVTGGQILAGVESKSAIGITSLAEAVTCLVGIITYVLVSKKPLDLTLAPWLIVGAVLSVPLAAKSVKLMGDKKLKVVIAVMTTVLGVLCVCRVAQP